MPATCRSPAAVCCRSSVQPAVTPDPAEPHGPTLPAVQQQLIVCEARFRSLTQLSSNWYWQQDVELRFIDTTSRNNDRGGLTQIGRAHV